MKRYLIGIDVGGTSVKAGLFETGRFPEICARRSVPTKREDSGEHIISDIADAVAGLLKEQAAGVSEVEGIGVGVPGPVIAGQEPGSTLVNRCVNLGWGVKDAASEIAAFTGVRQVEVMNDANAAALGELLYGSARDMAEQSGTDRPVTAVLVTIGTGIGGGIVQNGHIVRGAFGCAGEIGHMKMTPRHPLLKELVKAGSE